MPEPVPRSVREARIAAAHLAQGQEIPDDKKCVVGALRRGCEFVVHMLNATLKHNDNGDIHCKANDEEENRGRVQSERAYTSAEQLDR